MAIFAPKGTVHKDVKYAYGGRLFYIYTLAIPVIGYIGPPALVAIFLMRLKQNLQSFYLC